MYDMNQEFNPSAYIGSYVEYYVKGEDYEEEVIFIVSGIKGEAEVKINIKDFSSYDKNTLFYYKDGSDRLSKIEVENPRIVYNGEFLDENINQTMKSLNKGWIYIKDSDAKRFIRWLFFFSQSFFEACIPVLSEQNPERCAG